MLDYNVIWMGAALDPSGYGEATRNYLFALDKLGVNLKLINKVFWNGSTPEIDKDIAVVLKKMIERSFSENGNKSVLAFNVTPENYFIAPRIKIHLCITTFETDRVPDFWLVPIRAMDYVITYSKFNYETFLSSNINIPIHIVPHGVDINKFKPGLKTFPNLSSLKNNNFIFGANFDWTERKNPEALLEAYLKGFEGKKDVFLILKTFYRFPYEKSAEIIKNKIKEFKKKINFKSEYPKVVLITELLPGKDIPHFYNSLHCFVSPTRGEGWNLPASESCACAVPVIATNWSAHLEFLNKDNSLLVDYDLVTVKPKDIPEAPQYHGHKWANVKIDDLIDKMRYAYNNPDRMIKLGKKAREDMISKWTWDHAALKMKEFFDDVC